MDRQPLNQQVAARIRSELALRGWTQKDLAEAMQVPELWISRRLSAKSKRAVSLNLDELEQIATALRIPVLSLLEPRYLPQAESGPLRGSETHGLLSVDGRRRDHLRLVS